MEIAELDNLILENIADLDAATNRLWAIEQRVAEAVDDLKTDWAHANGWAACDRDWLTDGFSVGKPEWRPKDSNWHYRFQLDYENGDGDCEDVGVDSFWLTKLCGAGQGKIGFRFFQTQFGRNQWKRYLKDNAGRIGRIGFTVDDQPSIFLPLKLDRATQISYVKNGNYEACLKPMREALDHIRTNIKLFDDVIRDMKTRDT